MSDQTGTPGSEPFASELPDVHLADVQQELEPLKGMSLWARIKLSYRDMRATTRALIEERPSEPRLLFFVLFSDVIFFLARSVQLVVSPSESFGDIMPVPAQLGTFLLAVFLVRTMTLYVFSFLVYAVGKGFGGRGSWRDVRTGVFWASLVAAPVGVLGSLIGAGLANLEGAMPILAEPFVAQPPLYIGIVAFIFFLSAGVAEAHRFARISPVFIVFSVVAVLSLVAFFALYARFFV